MKPRIAYNEQDAWDQITEIDICSNCTHFKRQDLFTGECSYLGGPVSNDEKCEEFYAFEKRLNYWIDKLVEMAMEYSGENDFFRQLQYHETNGTEHEFLSLNSPK